MTTLDLVSRASEVREKEIFTPSINRYFDTFNQYDSEAEEIAFVIKPSLLNKSTWGYVTKIEDVINPSTKKSYYSDDYIEHFNKNKIAYNQVYLSEGVFNKITPGAKNAVIFFDTNSETIKKGKNTYKLHQYKVVNL